MVTLTQDGVTVTWVTDDGTITRDAVEEFTCESCHYLAWTISGLTGWQMMAVAADQSADDEEPDYAWVHVGVLTPDGNILDVEGVRDLDEWLNHWGDDASFIAEEEGCLANCDYAGHIIPRDQFAQQLQLADPAAAEPQFAAATSQLAQLLLATMPAYDPSR